MKKSSIYQFCDSNALFLILTLAFIIRITFFLSLQPWNPDVVEKTVLVSDATGYHQTALAILSDKSLEGVSAFRTPGYPVFVALLYGISWKSVWFVLLIQVFLNLVSVFLVYKIASETFTRSIGLLSAFLFAVDMHQAFFAVTLLTDTLFVFLFLATVWFLVKSIKEGRFHVLCYSALILGVATLVRPISFLFPVVIVVFVFLARSLLLKTKVLYALAFILIFCASISPWLFHNYSKYGVAQLSSITGYNTLYYNTAYTEVYRTGKTIEDVRKEITGQAVRQGADTTDLFSFRNSAIFSGIAKQYMMDNPVLYAKRHMMGIVNLFTHLGTKPIVSVFSLPASDVKSELTGGGGIFTQIETFYRTKSAAEVIISIFLVAYLLVNYFFSVYCFAWTREKKNRFVWFFILIVIYFAALTGVVGVSRYRLPIMPFINILCAAGIYHFYGRFARRQTA
jgi:4-amino-4-deoxy-L-arabinose transferase-like glycosyltransferase